jgi:tetratricopeptide (TPR) repeat protein
MPFDLKNIPQDLLELSYIVYRARHYLCHDEIPAFFAGMGKETEFVGDLGNWMYSFGLLSDPADFRSVNPQAEEKLRDALAGKTEGLDWHIATFLWSMYEKGSLQSDFSLYEVFASLSFSVPDAFLVGCLYSVHDPGATARAVCAHFSDPEIPESVIALEKARHQYDSGYYDEAILIAKNTLHTFQKASIFPGEYRVLSLIAMLSLARNHADDAIVYLEYALENAERMHDPRSSLATRFSMAIVYFILGNYHFALCNLESVNQIVERCYAKDWEVLILFMKGRILFELGNYTDAELLFQTAASLASVYQIPESVSLSRVWYARSLVHEGRYATAESVLRDCAQTIPEAWIYLLESAILSGHPQPDLPARRPEFPCDRIDYDGPESFSWRSGYSLAENFCFGAASAAGVATRMYDAFALVYRYRFEPGVDGAESARLVAQVARSAQDVSDPYTDLYFYFSYDIGKSAFHADAPDTMVFLSRAFKFMQKRANEIEDNNLREQFMQNPTWNSRLWREARLHMLI